ncbi:MAG: nucleotidyltransferase domain-containing protein [Bacillota bacterium]
MQPTPYPDVNALLSELLSSLRGILGDRFVGLYLHGSLAAGDFVPGRSDIDFLVVTDGDLSDEVVAVLKAMHERLLNASGGTAPGRGRRARLNEPHKHRRPSAKDGRHHFQRVESATPKDSPSLEVEFGRDAHADGDRAVRIQRRKGRVPENRVGLQTRG